MQDYKKLRVWRRGMDLVRESYALTRTLPDDERFGLSTQMRRCAVSVPSNIAEGSGRRTDREFLRFLRIAFGSSFELETQALMCRENGVGSEKLTLGLLETNSEVQRMLHGLIAAIESSET